MTVELSSIRGRGVFRLKGWNELPLGLPFVLEETATHVMNIGPRDWLITASTPDAAGLRERVAPTLTQLGMALVDMSDGLAGLRLKGSHARDVLSKGCGLDLHPRQFPAGQCTRTRLAQ